MNRSRIEWCDYTFNPVTGCLHGCEYCYARRVTCRFTLAGSGTGELHDLTHPETRAVHMDGGGCQVRTIPFPYDFDPTFHRYRLNDPQRVANPSNIFVCSMADLFGDWVPTSWIQEVFNACEKAPQHNYLFLTKNPPRYIDLAKRELLPRKHWYGYSATTEQDLWQFKHADECPCLNLIISIEPIHGDFHGFSPSTHCPADWVIVGAETGNRKERVTPKREWIERLAETCAYSGVPLFMKNSLRDLMGSDFRQEFPKELGGK